MKADSKPLEEWLYSRFDNGTERWWLQALDNVDRYPSVSRLKPRRRQR